MLEKLRTLNPDIPFYSVNDPEFCPFGRVLSFPADGLITACERNVPMTESGSKYVPDMPDVEEKDFAAVQPAGRESLPDRLLLGLFQPVELSGISPQQRI